MAGDQEMLFGGIGDGPAREEPVEPAETSEAHRVLSKKLPADLWMGTSSWSFPGWRGIVWNGSHDGAALAKRGLAAYARHPLLRAVGIDRTFYAPVGESDFRSYAKQTPDDFRFLVKAPQAVTQPWRQDTMEANPTFLDAELVTRQWLEPAARGLGEKLGVFVFQFTPLGREIRPDADGFITRLSAFLNALPSGLPLAVEVRDAAIVGERYRDALRTCGVDHCYNVHPKAATLEEQARWFPASEAGRVVVRWMLGGGQDYESAKAAYAPFDKIKRPDAATRDSIAALARAGRPTIVILNNKAEGSAPLSVFRLAGRIAGVS